MAMSGTGAGSTTGTVRRDHGHLFGAKTFDARKSRRVIWAWVDDTDSHVADVAKGWTGIQSFPRALWLDSDGKIAGGLQEIAGVEVVFEIPNLEEVEQLDPKWLQDPHGLCAEKGASVQGVVVGPFGLIAMASDDMQEQTNIFFRGFKNDRRPCRDGKRRAAVFSD